MSKTVEYRVRPVTRYILTCYTSDDNHGSIETLGEFQNEDSAIRAKNAFFTESRHTALMTEKRGNIVAVGGSDGEVHVIGRPLAG